MTRIALVLLVIFSFFMIAADMTEKNSTAAPRPNPENLRVITYNVLYGFEDKMDQCPIPGEERRLAVTGWLKEQRPDVVAFQELNGYTQERLLEEAKAWGHEHALLLSKSAFCIGVTSKYPIDEIEQHKQGMHHGLIHCKTAGIHIFATHYSPHKYKHRQQEAAMTLQRIAAVMANGEQALLLGDLNSLSPVNEQRMVDSGALDYYRQREKELDFLRNLNEDYFDFSVIQSILDAGLIDLYHTAHPDSDFWPRTRIDFIFASPGIAEKCVQTQWIANDTMRTWSDHYPVIADFDWKPTQ